MASTCIDCRGSGRPIPWSSPDFPLATCSRCGLVFLSTWQHAFTDGGTFHAGNVAYYEAMEADGEGTALSDLNQRRLREMLESLAALVPTRSMLDVGCGTGGAVAAARSVGWEARGIDLAPGAVRIAQSQGLDCRPIDLFSPEMDDTRVGLVYMSEFIEHVPEPSRFLARAGQLLVEDGVLHLTTPNFNSLGRRVLGPDWAALSEGHVSFATSRTMEGMARRAGFRVHRTRTDGLSASALRSLVGRRRTAGSVSGEEQFAATQELRRSVDRSWWGRLAKRVADPVVGVSGLGETLKMTLVRDTQGA